MIPKTIHYCWFGRNPKPKLAEKCIKSWKKYCPDYEIIEWNEDNFDIASAPLYVRQAYEAKKWAFVTDYVRLKVVYENGGLYFDTDVQIIKAFDELLDFSAFFGFEDEQNINTGLGFGSEKNVKILNDIILQYSNIPFVLEDGTFDSIPCPKRNTEIFKEYGLSQDGTKQLLNGNIIILPKEYLCPIEYHTSKKRITENTLSIHWFDTSWVSKETKKEIIKVRRAEQRDKIKHLPNKALMKIMGEKKYNEIKKKIKR